MSCFPCFQSQKSKNRHHNGENSDHSIEPKPQENKKQKSPRGGNRKEETPKDESGNINAQTFTFRELATATKNFRQECLLGEGGFGRVYKGTLQLSGQVVAVKQLDRNGLQGNKEFLVEVLMLSLLHHQNLVNLIGYCADGDQRLLVYEFMSGGSLEDHLLEKKDEQKPLDWITRIKIALGAAQGLEYLHDKANPPVIYRDLKSSNILLDENFVPKLSDFGLAKLGPLGDKVHVSSRVMGTYGYCAPEYARSGHLTVKSDVYSFGVVLLELITGRRVVDTTRPVDEQNLVSWAQPIFRDPKRFPDMADPLLKRRFPEKGLNQAVAIAAMCLQEEAAARPLMSDVVTALSFLSMDKEEIPLPSPDPIPTPEEKPADNCDEDKDGSSDDDDEEEEEENEKVEDENSATNSNGDSSSEQDKYSSDNQVEESVDQEKEGSNDGSQTSGSEIQKIGSNSGEGSSSRRSISTSSNSSQDGNCSLNNEGSWETSDGSTISSDRKSKGSGKHGGSSRKSKKELPSSRSEKSRKADGSDCLNENKRCKSLSTLNQKNSRKSKDRSGSSRHKSIKKTPDETTVTSQVIEPNP